MSKLMSVFRWQWRKPQTIYECCRMLCLIQFLLGCSGIRSRMDKYTSDCKALSYTLVASSSIVVVMLITAYVKFHDPYMEEMDSLVKSIIYLELGMSLFMYVVTTTTMVANAKTHLQLYQRINDLDRILILDFGCDMRYEQLVKKNLMQICFIVMIYMTITILGATLSSSMEELLVNILAGMAYSFATGGPLMNCNVQMNFAELLAIRFRLLQKLLQVNFTPGYQLEEQRLVERLQRLIELVQQYHDCVDVTNKIFSKSLAATILHDFTLTTSELYLIFGGLTSSGSSALIYFVLLGIVLPFYKMTMAPVYCENSIKEGDKCFKVIQDIDFQFPGNKEVREMVSASLMWRWDNRIQFTSGTMILNKQVIAAVYLEIFNYILILIQFRMTQEMGDQIEKQKNTIQDWIGVDYV